MQNKNTSSHILNASSNLLGLCFIVLTSLKVLKLKQSSMIDEWTAVATILFMASCMLSFLSIRSEHLFSKKSETMAECCFMLGLGILFIMTMIIGFDIIR